MRTMILLFWMGGLALPDLALAQVDTMFTWRAYSREGTLHLLTYEHVVRGDRPHTIVMREMATNRGPSSVDDARHLVELIGREYSIDPESATWIFHWGSFSFSNAQGTKHLFLRATFRRTKTGALSTPTWRVISREEVEELTARRYP